jgi:hypothetical protein
MNFAVVVLALAKVVSTEEWSTADKDANNQESYGNAIYSIKELLAWVSFQLPESKTILNFQAGKKINYGRAFLELSPLGEDSEGQDLLVQAKSCVDRDEELSTQLETAITQINSQSKLERTVPLFTCLFASIVICISGIVFALQKQLQKQTDTLNITVLDNANNSPVSDAVVNIKDEDSMNLSKHSGVDGIVIFEKQDLKPPIVVTASKNGYENYIAKVRSEKDDMLKSIRLKKLTQADGKKKDDSPQIPTADNGWSKTEKIGKDAQGGSANFNFYSLISDGDKHRWKFESDSQVVIENKRFMQASLFFKKKLRSLEDRIQKDDNLIAVGNASCEGDSTKEGKRARNRADMIYRSIQENLSNKAYRLILGKYQDGACSEKKPDVTISQRSIIVITFNQATPGLNKTEATKDAFREVLKDPEFKKNLYGHFRDKEDSPLSRELDIDKYACFELGVSPPECR